MAIAGAPTRRRGDALERAIYDAVFHQLQTVGYSRLTMEGVAGCAQTGKAALYRRWAGKDDLVVDAIDHALPSLADLPDHGDVREDLLDLLRRMAAMVNSPTGCALQCLLAQADRDHQFSVLLHERVLAPRKGSFLAVLRRAADRGQVRPEAASPGGRGRPGHGGAALPGRRPPGARRLPRVGARRGRHAPAPPVVSIWARPVRVEGETTFERREEQPRCAR